MKLLISLDLNNAAFEQDGTQEITRILADLSERLPEPLKNTSSHLSLHDLNGNYVGSARIEG